MLDRSGFAGELALTGDLDRALDGADFVLLQIRVGGQAARLQDETVPLACGCIGQETTGAGGFAKAMRTVPVVLDIAERVAARSAPGAWIVDFTNPVGIVTRALLDAGHRAIGLCNVAIGFQRQFARMLGVEPGRVLVDQVGLNHLTWVRAVRVDGDGRARRPARGARRRAGGRASASRAGCSTSSGAVPSYYLHYFYAHDAVLAEQRTGVPRAATVAEIERELLEMYRDPSLTEKPALLEQRGGAYYSEAAVGLVASLSSGDDAVHVVDVRNGGTLAGLRRRRRRRAAGTRRPRRRHGRSRSRRSRPSCSASSQHVAAYERLAAQAAVTRDEVTARKALLAHPLIGQHEIGCRAAARCCSPEPVR